MTATRQRLAHAFCSCLLVLVMSMLRLTAQTVTVPQTAAGEFISALSAAIEAERQTLHALRQVAGEVLQDLEINEPKERYLALTEDALTLHASAPADAPGMPATTRTILEGTLKALNPEPEPPVFTVLDEQQKWTQLTKELDTEARRASQELDALRLIRKAQTSEGKSLESLVQAEHVIELLRKERDTPRAARTAQFVREQMNALPPPALFTHSLGIDLVLLTLEPPVYVSKQPITWKPFSLFLANSGLPPAALPWPASVVKFDPASRKYTAAAVDAPVTQLSYDLAVAFCKWASAKAEIALELPQVTHLRRGRQTETLALWTSTAWAPADAFAQEMQSRFAVRMFTVWDPLRRISAGETVGEVPFATHPELGFRVAASIETVKKARLQRLYSEMNLPPENSSASTGKATENLP